MPVVSIAARIRARDLLLAAFLVRLAAIYIHPIRDSLYSDMGNYMLIADELRGGGPWKATHFFQPIGFPSIAVVFKSLFTDWATALGLFQTLLSTATAAVVWRCAHLSFGPRVGMLALLVAAFHVPWVMLSTVALPETTFTFLLAVLLWLTLRVLEHASTGWSALWGLVFLLAFIVKGSHAFFGPMFLLGFLAWRGWSRQAVQKVALPISAVVGAGLLLHGALAYRAIGSFEMISTEGGLNFVEGKCFYKQNFDSTGAGWYSPLYTQLGRAAVKKWDRPFTDHRYFMNEGLKCIRRNPRVLATSLEGIPFLFVGNTLWPATQFPTAPFTRAYDLVFGVLLAIGLGLGYKQMWPLTERTYWLFIAWALPFLGLCLTVYVFKSEIRFRVPFDVWLIPVAVSGWTALADRMLSRAGE
jgi:dolichyl-phosphate-mannose-protein mannosyltransferase